MKAGQIVSKLGLQNDGWSFLRHYSTTTEIWEKGESQRLMYNTKERVVVRVYDATEERYSTGGWI